MTVEIIDSNPQVVRVIEQGPQGPKGDQGPAGPIGPGIEVQMFQQTVTAGQTNVDITDITGFDRYKLVIRDARPTGSAVLTFRTSNDNGVSFEGVSNDYRRNTVEYVDDLDSAGRQRGDSGTPELFITSLTGAVTASKLNLELNLESWGNVNTRSFIRGHGTMFLGSKLAQAFPNIIRNANQITNAIRLTWAATTWAEGIVTLYGIND